MKRIPAGLLAASLAFLPLLAATADESAQQLADQTLGATPAADQDQSAAQLADQQGLGDNTPGTDPEESAGALATQQGLQGNGSTATDQSAASLATQQGLEQPAGQDSDQSAASLAEQQGLEAKPKVTTSAAPAATGSVFADGQGVEGSVYAVLALADGSTIIGGQFTRVNGQARLNLARIAPDGTLDPKFLAAPTDGVSGAVYALARFGKGRIAVGGYFTSAQGQPAQNLVAYSLAGQRDPAFGQNQSPNGPVYAIAVQKSGQLVVGGQFSQVGDTPCRNVARFNPDGTLVGPVNEAATSTGTVRALAALPGGGAVAGGTFEIPGQPAGNLLRAQ